MPNYASSRNWDTSENKAIFCDDDLPKKLTHEIAETMTERPVLTLQTMRSHDQYNTTIYGMNDRYRGVYGERNVLFISAEDMSKQKLKNGDHVNIRSIANDGIERSISNFKVIEYTIPKGCVAAYYPETNPLVPLESVAEDCGTPTYKSIAISIEKVSID